MLDWRIVMKLTTTVAGLLLTILTCGCGGYSAPKATPAQPGVVPVIAELSPQDANAGSPAFMLTVNGSSFSTGATVNFNGMQQATTYVTAKQLAAMIPASEISTPGMMPVTVTNPATPGAGGIYGASGGTTAQTSEPMTFTIK
jgi:hypothetical protein